MDGGGPGLEGSPIGEESIEFGREAPGGDPREQSVEELVRCGSGGDAGERHLEEGNKAFVIPVRFDGIEEAEEKPRERVSVKRFLKIEAGRDAVALQRGAKKRYVGMGGADEDADIAWSVTFTKKGGDTAGNVVCLVLFGGRTDDGGNGV